MLRIDGHWQWSAKSAAPPVPARGGRQFASESCGLPTLSAVTSQWYPVTGSPAWIYWPGLAVFVAASLGLAGLIVRALMTEAWSGAAFVAAFLALFLWQAGNIFRRNRPGAFSPDAVPPQVLPKI